MDSDKFVEALRVIEQFANEFLEKEEGEFILAKPVLKGTVIIEVTRCTDHLHVDPEMN